MKTHAVTSEHHGNIKSEPRQLFALVMILPVLRIAAATARAVPVIGFTVEGVISVVLEIAEIAENAKTCKEQCIALVTRATLFIVEIVHELSRLDAHSAHRRWLQCSAFLGTLERIKHTAIRLANMSRLRRALSGRSTVNNDICALNRELDDAAIRFSFKHQLKAATSLDQLHDLLQTHIKASDVQMEQSAQTAGTLRAMGTDLKRLSEAATQFDEDGEFRIYRLCELECLEQRQQCTCVQSTAVRVCRVRTWTDGHEVVAKFHSRNDPLYEVKLEMLKRLRVVPTFEQLVGFSQRKTTRPFYVVHAGRTCLRDLARHIDEYDATRLLLNIYYPAVATLRYSDLVDLLSDEYWTPEASHDSSMAYTEILMEHGEHKQLKLLFRPYFTTCHGRRVIFELEVAEAQAMSSDSDVGMGFSTAVGTAWSSSRLTNRIGAAGENACHGTRCQYTGISGSRLKVVLAHIAAGPIIKHRYEGIGIFESGGFVKVHDSETDLESEMGSGCYLFRHDGAGSQLEYHGKPSCYSVTESQGLSHLSVYHFSLNESIITSLCRCAPILSAKHSLPSSSFWIATAVYSSAATGILGSNFAPSPLFFFHYPHPGMIIGPTHIAAGFWSLDENGTEGSIVRSVKFHPERHQWSMILQLGRLKFWMRTHVTVRYRRMFETEQIILQEKAHPDHPANCHR